MTERPTIAYLVAAYNVGASIATTIESILDQTEPADEVLICDDGSTDDTAEVVERYPSVRLIRQTHQGQAAALNRLASAAASEWLALVNAADRLDPRHLEHIRAEALATPSDTAIITTDAWVHETDGSSHRYYDAVPWVEGRPEQRAAILSYNFVFSAATVRASAWAQAGGMRASLRCGADWDLWLRLVRRRWTVALVPEPLYHHVRCGSATAANAEAILRARIDVLTFAWHEEPLNRSEALTVASARWRARRDIRWMSLAKRARRTERRTRRPFLALGAADLWSTAGAKAPITRSSSRGTNNHRPTDACQRPESQVKPNNQDKTRKRLREPHEHRR